MKKICIVGGGIVGSSVAYFLSKNHDVTLIDANKSQASKNAVGIICPWLSLRRNKKWLALVTQGAQFYKTLKKEIPHLPYFQTGTICFKKNEMQIDKIIKNLEKQKIDIHYTHYHNEYSFIDTNEPGIYTTNGGRVNGEKFISCLQEAFLKNKGKIIIGEAIYQNQILTVNHTKMEYDAIVFTSGAWLKETLKHDYIVDIYPQKGQLVQLQTDLNTDALAGMMLNGEIDILPQENGIIAIGATHENDMGFDTTIDQNLCQDMITFAAKTMPSLTQYPIVAYRVGTRAYTRDFLPFFGQLEKNIYVASGLGSTGLTCGPFIGYTLSKLINNEEVDLNLEDYSPFNYIKKIKPNGKAH